MSSNIIPEEALLGLKPFRVLGLGSVVTANGYAAALKQPLKSVEERCAKFRCPTYLFTISSTQEEVELYIIPEKYTLSMLIEDLPFLPEVFIKVADSLVSSPVCDYMCEFDR